MRLGDRLGPSACLQTVYDHTDLFAVLAADPDGEQRIANLLRLQERARYFDSRGGLRAFVRMLRLSTDPQLKAMGPGDEPAAPIAGESDDVVRLLTVHQAKGLEFPIVLVAGCTTRERTDSPAVAYDRAVGLGLTHLPGGRARAHPGRPPRRRIRPPARRRRVGAPVLRRRHPRPRAADFLGESGPRPRLSGTWRAHLDALLAESAEQGSPPLLTLWRPGPRRHRFRRPSPSTPARCWQRPARPFPWCTETQIRCRGPWMR